MLASFWASLSAMHGSAMRERSAADRQRSRADWMRELCSAFVVLGFALGCQSSHAASAGTEGQASAPDRNAHAASAPADAPIHDHVKADGQLGPGAGVLLIDIAAPAGAQLTLDAPVSARASGGIGLGFPQGLSGPLGQHALPLRLPIDVADGATGPAQIELSYFWCTDGAEAACRRELALLSVDLDLTGSGAGGEAHLSHRARAN